MEHELSNEEVKIAVSDHGAELTHLVKKATGEEYIWSGEDYWKRHSPVLFPFVGNVADGYYSAGGKRYPMGQHGFARDMDFAFEGEKDGLWFHLDYTEETLQKYPFRFHLRIGYTLSGRTVGVHWEVTTDDDVMPFMIGAHPAFNCPPLVPGEDGSLMKRPFGRTGCFVNFHCGGQPEYGLLDGKLVGHETKPLPLTDGRLELNDHVFDRDALIIAGDEIHELSLEDREQKPFLTIRFDAPLFGVWSPAGDVPFVCLEPWYGRSDRTGFSGDLSEREYEQSVKKWEVFSRGYTVTIA